MKHRAQKQYQDTAESMNVILSVKMCYLLKIKKTYRKCILTLLLEFKCHFISQNVLFIKNTITTVNAF